MYRDLLERGRLNNSEFLNIYEIGRKQILNIPTVNSVLTDFISLGKAGFGTISATIAGEESNQLY